MEIVDKVTESINNIIMNMRLPCYNYVKKIGVWRNLNVRIYENQYLITLMLSRGVLTEIDIVYISKS